MGKCGGDCACRVITIKVQGNEPVAAADTNIGARLRRQDRRGSCIPAGQQGELAQAGYPLNRRLCRTEVDRRRGQGIVSALHQQRRVLVVSHEPPSLAQNGIWSLKSALPFVLGGAAAVGLMRTTLFFGGYSPFGST